MLRQPLITKAEETSLNPKHEEIAVELSLQKALLAYHANILELRVVASGMIKHLATEPTEAERQMRVLLNQGYQLAVNAEGGYYFTQGLVGGSPLALLEKKLDMKPASQKSVFITYQWGQKSIAQALEAAFEAKGFLVIRDEATLQHNVYLPGFMKIIKHKNLDYVLPIISSSYLKSKSCMYEVNQLVNRYNWQDTLLPYVVSENAEADAHIYSSITPYIEHWQQALEKETQVDERKIIENILENIRPFVSAITTRINIPESTLISTRYEALFEMIANIEGQQGGAKFKEIEELLEVASKSEKLKRHPKVKETFDAALAKLEEMQHVSGTDAIFGKVYGLYGEYLLRQKETKQGEEYLEIAVEFGYVRGSSSGSQSSSVTKNTSTTSFSSSSSSATFVDPTTPPAKAMAFSPMGVQVSTASSNSSSATIANPVTKVDAKELKQFLTHVAYGEQDEAEKMLQNNPDLAIVHGDVTDLSNRTFKDITGFQYAMWALDWHMWTMIQKYFPDDGHYDDYKQYEEIETRKNEPGYWAHKNLYDIHANWDNLTKALQIFIDLGAQKKHNEANTIWNHKVGSAQRELPANVVNWYCNPKQPFTPCPNFEKVRTLPRSRKIQFFDEREKKYKDAEWFSFSVDGESLGTGFGVDSRTNAIKRGVAAQPPIVQLPTTQPPVAGFVTTTSKAILIHQDMLTTDPFYYIKDLISIRTLFEVGIRLREKLIAELKQKLDGNHFKRKFLQFVTEGEQEEAEKMLRKNPGLALVHEDVTDLSNRTFKGITGFQYAMWALDWHMWTMIRKYLPDDGDYGARKQYEEIETRKDEPGYWAHKNLHDIHANWNNLINAYEKVIDLCSQRKKDEANTAFVHEIGKAQLQIPVHVVNHYCDPRHSFDPCPDFTNNSLPRSRETSDSRGEHEDWFSRDLGNTLACLRGKSKGAICQEGKAMIAMVTRDFANGEKQKIPLDHMAVRTLFEQRLDQYEKLTAELKQGNRQVYAAKK